MAQSYLNTVDSTELLNSNEFGDFFSRASKKPLFIRLRPTPSRLVGIGVRLSTYLTLVLYGGVSLSSWSSYSQGKETWYPMICSLGGLQLDT